RRRREEQPPGGEIGDEQILTLTFGAVCGNDLLFLLATDRRPPCLPRNPHRRDQQRRLGRGPKLQAGAKLTPIATLQSFTAGTTEPRSRIGADANHRRRAPRSDREAISQIPEVANKPKVAETLPDPPDLTGEVGSHPRLRVRLEFRNERSGGWSGSVAGFSLQWSSLLWFVLAIVSLNGCVRGRTRWILRVGTLVRRPRSPSPRRVAHGASPPPIPSSGWKAPPSRARVGKIRGSIRGSG
ncbi:hypothetical protein U1Q18_038841, partial [Sarracenia purpurea var. burkii]